MKHEINVLPAPTFRWLKMNGTSLEEALLPQDQTMLTAEAGEKKFLILMDDGQQKSLTGKYVLNLEADSEMNVIQVITDSGEEPIIQQIEADCGENALLHVFWIFIGGKAVYPSVNVDLSGDGSSFEMDAAYVVHPQGLLDMNVVANHIGKKTTSRIEAKGVLYDRARKIFRGTIDLRKGCKGASGDEREEVLLMDDEAVNQTIPLILCSEEDVAGNHGASIGQIDEDVQFYMESRGITPEEIEQLLLDARINAVIAKMPAEVRCTVGSTMGAARSGGKEGTDS